MGAYLHTIRVNFNHVFDDATHRFIDSIDYQPAVLWVQPGDGVRWISNYNLKVCFQKGTPFGHVQIQTDAEVPSAPETVLPNAAKRGYSYHTHGALKILEVLLFYGDPGCPELIVE